MFLIELGKFWDSESGAVTVDWVVLTAAVAGIGFAVLMVIAPGLRSKAEVPAPSLIAAPGLGAALVTEDADS